MRMPKANLGRRSRGLQETGAQAGSGVVDADFGGAERNDERHQDERGRVPGGGVDLVPFARVRDRAEEAHQTLVHGRAAPAQGLARPRKRREQTRRRGAENAELTLRDRRHFSAAPTR